jgi:hypothetical protein
MIFTIIFLLLGLLLNGVPSNPDAVFPPQKFLGIIFTFSAWSISIIAWGNLISHVFKMKTCNFINIHGMLFGTLWGVLVVTLLGTFGLIGIQNYPLHLSVLLSGVVINTFFKKEDENYPSLKTYVNFLFLKENLFFTVLLIVIGFFCFILLATSFMVNSHGDSLTYHLVSPRWWFESGKIILSTNNPLIYHAGYWDYLYVWSNILIGGEKSNGLLEVQILSQLIHFFFGFFGSCYALYSILSNQFLNFKKNLDWILLAILAGVSSESFMWMSYLAKNDWGLIFWTLGGLIFLSENKFLAGIFWGMVIATKLPHAYIIIGFIAGSIVVFRKSILLLGLGLFVGAMPLWLRNFLEVKNPFYPILNSIFKSEAISQSFNDFNKIFLITKTEMNWHHWSGVLVSLFQENPIIILIFFIPYVAMKIKNNKQDDLYNNLIFYIISFGTTISLFVFSVGSTWFWRYTGAFFIIANTVGVMVLGLFFKKYAGFRKLLCLILIAIPLYRYFNNWPINFNNILNPAEAIRTHKGGEAKAWLRLNMKKDEVVIDPYDPQMYYLMGKQVRNLEFDPDLDSKTFSSNSTKEICTKIKDLKAKYLLDSTYPMPWGKRTAIFYRTIEQFPQTIIFQGRNSRVIDFQLLCSLASRENGAKIELIPILNP